MFTVICPRCNMKVTAGSFCSNCGSELPPDSPRHPISRWWASLTIIERAMMVTGIIIILFTISGIIDEATKPGLETRAVGGEIRIIEQYPSAEKYEPRSAPTSPPKSKK